MLTQSSTKHILVHAELQMRSHGSSNLRTGPVQQDGAPQSTKRYLILAYKAEFDQILYPLPLCPEHSPSPEFFRNIIKGLQAEKQAALQVRMSCLPVPLIQCQGKLNEHRVLHTVPNGPARWYILAASHTFALTWHSCRRLRGTL